MEPTVTTILLSYNRPRMLGEALVSLFVAEPDAVIVVDDGSDFDVRGAILPTFPRARFVEAGKLTVEERLRTARLGRLINTALSMVETTHVAYLCDDDLFAPGWLHAVRNYFAVHPGDHWVRGGWNIFRDGETPGGEPCPLDHRQMTTGNFAHAAACFFGCGFTWNESSVACHDDMMLWDVDRFHSTHAVPEAGALAGWRRSHAFNALRYTQNAIYTRDAADLFREGWLE